MEVRICKRCQRNFLFDSGPIDLLNQCPRCSGSARPKEHLDELVFRGCLVIGSVLAAWALVGSIKLILGVQ